MLLLVLFPAFASAQQLQETITVERVLIDARVTDSHGDPILGLEPEDFVVKFDGKLAKVESVDWIPETAVAREVAGVEKEDVQVTAPASTPDVIAPAGRLFIIFIQTDFGRANVRVRGQMHFMQSAEKILEMMEPEDRAAVFSFDSHLKFRLDFTSDPDDIRYAMESAMKIDEPNWPRIVSNPSLARRLDRDEMKKATSAEESLVLIGNALRPIPGPKSMLLLGWGLGYLFGGRVHMPKEYVVAKRVLETARVSIFALDTTEADYHDLEVGLQQAADDTGGFYAKTHIFPGLAIERLHRTLSGHYELEVRRPDELKRGVHTIEVTVRRKGVINVLARSTWVDNPAR